MFFRRAVDCLKRRHEKFLAHDWVANSDRSVLDMEHFADSFNHMESAEFFDKQVSSSFFAWNFNVLLFLISQITFCQFFLEQYSKTDSGLYQFVKSQHQKYLHVRKWKASTLPKSLWQDAEGARLIWHCPLLLFTHEPSLESGSPVSYSIDINCKN